jgi:MFS family permease
MIDPSRPSTQVFGETGVAEVGWRRSAGAVTLAWASSVVALAVIPAFLTGALVVQMRSDFEVTPVTLGLLIGLFFGAAALASGPAGRVVQRVGPLAGMQAATIGAAISMGGVAIFVHDAASLGFFLVVGGLANSAANPAANLLLLGTMPPARRALALGVKQAAIPIATLLAGVSIPTLALTLGWRWAFIVVAGVAVAVVLFGWTRRHQSRVPGRVVDGVDQDPQSASVRHQRDILLLALAGMLGIWGGQAMGAFLVSYTVSLGQSPAAAGLILTLASLAGITARILAGWVIDRRRTTGVAELKSMLAVGVIGLTLIAVGLPTLAWFGPLLAFAGGWGWSGVMTYVAVRLEPDAPAAATGITQAGVFLGATVGVPLFGVIVEASSYHVAWAATAATMVLALLIVHVVGRRSGLDRRSRPASGVR